MRNNPSIEILSTRPLRDDIVHKAALKQVAIDTASFIATQPVDNETLRTQINDIATSSNVVAIFTSMNAVESVIQKLSAPPTWKLFTMGGITKELTIQFFGETNFLASAKNATALAEKIVHHGGINKVVYFCGDQRLDELPETLKANGIAVEEIVVYETIQTPVDIQKNYTGIVFFSPSAVHSFFSLNTIPTNTILFSIGKTTTACIKTYVTNEVVTSDWPGKEQMIDQVIAYYTAVNHA